MQLNMNDPSIDVIKRKVQALEGKLVAIECYWDGDTYGWFVVLCAILMGASAAHPKYKEYDITVFQGEGGDARLFFQSGFPPESDDGQRQWPEAAEAAAVAKELASQLSVPFHFASPFTPSDDVPRWWDHA